MRNSIGPTAVYPTEAKKLPGDMRGGLRTVDFRLWGWKSITIINTHERRVAFHVDCCRNALDLLSSSKWNFKGVSNFIYGLDEFDRANREMESKPKGFIKALVRCNDW